MFYYACLRAHFPLFSAFIVLSLIPVHRLAPFSTPLFYVQFFFALFFVFFFFSHVSDSVVSFPPLFCARCNSPSFSPFFFFRTLSPPFSPCLCFACLVLILLFSSRRFPLHFFFRTLFLLFLSHVSSSLILILIFASLCAPFSVPLFSAYVFFSYFSLVSFSLC